MNGNSFEEFEFGRPDDFCYLINENVKFTNTPGNLHFEFVYSSADCLAYEAVFLISEIFVLLPVTYESQGTALVIDFLTVSKRT